MSDSACAAVEELLVQQAADSHAADARMLAGMADFVASGAWQGHGIRSFGHWCDVNLGIPSGRANRLARAAERLAGLPVLAAAFAAGTVSLDKILLVAPVASPVSDEKLTGIAVSASVAQLQRICSALRDLDRDESPEAKARRAVKRGVSSSRDDGLVKIIAVLEPEEAAIVLAAVDSRVEENWRHDREVESDVPRRELSDRRADALVECCTDALVTGPEPVVRGEKIEVRVNVDEGVLRGDRDDGVCEIEGIGAVTPSVVRRLLCDARVCTVREELDAIFNQGRSIRTPNRRQRRALQRRDGGCRFPGCRMRRYVDAHHVLPWEWDGPTDMDNLVLLCTAHHALFHEGDYRIECLGGGRFEFLRPDGRPLAPSPPRARPGPEPPAAGVPRATDGGAPFDLELTVWALEQRRLS
jgi:hypothetical protein